MAYGNMESFTHISYFFLHPQIEVHTPQSFQNLTKPFLLQKRFHYGPYKF